MLDDPWFSGFQLEPMRKIKIWVDGYLEGSIPEKFGCIHNSVMTKRIVSGAKKIATTYDFKMQSDTKNPSL